MADPNAVVDPPAGDELPGGSNSTPPVSTSTGSSTASTVTNSTASLSGSGSGSSTGVSVTDARPSASGCMAVCAAVTKLVLIDFDDSNPEAWFDHIEIEFELNRITSDQTKYANAFSKLPASVRLDIDYAIKKMPRQDRYPYLKGVILQNYGASNAEKISRNCRLRPLGDSKPSSYIWQVVRNVPEAHSFATCPGCDLRYAAPACPQVVALILQQFPSKLRDKLSDEYDSYEALAKKADQIWRKLQTERQINVSSQPEVNAVYYSTESSSDSESEQCSAAFSRRPQRRSSKPPRKAKVQSKAPPQASKKSGYCFYHDKFGTKASKCRPPCSWSGNGSANRR